MDQKPPRPTDKTACPLASSDSARPAVAKGKRSSPTDLEIYVSFDSNAEETKLNYQLHSPLGDFPFVYTTIQGMPIRTSLEAFRNRLIERLEGLLSASPVGPGLTSCEVVEKIESFGRELYDELFPKELRRVYSQLRLRLRKLRLVSEEPWIPWELVKPFESNPGFGEAFDDDFLCMRFELTRWLAGGTSPLKEIGVQRLACIEAGDASGRSQLPYAVEERRLLSLLAASHPGIDDLSPAECDRQTVKVLLENGGFQLLHVAAHGESQPQFPGESCIVLSDGKSLRAEDLRGRIQTAMGEARPMVFFNACRTGQQGWALTGLGGWARMWVRNCLCGGFIGPQWSVSDEMANLFAQVFYEGLQKGATIAEASLQARRQLRESRPDDPSWLAYSVYAHPQGKLLLGEAGDGLKEAMPALEGMKPDDVQAARQADPRSKKTLRIPNRRKKGSLLGRYRRQILVAALLVIVSTLIVSYWQTIWRPAEPMKPFAGRVTDEPTGQAVSEAVVFLMDTGGVPPRVRTDSDGIFQFQVSPGNYRLRVEAEGYLPWSNYIQLSAFEMGLEDIRLQPVPSVDSAQNQAAEEKSQQPQNKVEIHQTTSGSCSPAVAGVSGTLDIEANCPPDQKGKEP